MTVPISPVTLADIQTEFGGSNPISLSEYYRGGAFVYSGQGDAGYGVISASGPISMGAFRNQTAAGEVVYSAPGTYSFVVPGGVSTLNAIIIGGGGGGGASDDGGDNRSGGAGGSGGIQYAVPISVTGGETITIDVGAGGLKARWLDNGGNPRFGTSGTTGNRDGGTGAQSQVRRGGTPLSVAGGGGGGIGNVNDGAVVAVPGVAGSPLGNGAEVQWWNRNDYPLSVGGQNGTSFGVGGNSNGNLASVLTNTTDGSNGYVWLGWGGFPVPFARALTSGSVGVTNITYDDTTTGPGSQVNFQFSPDGDIRQFITGSDGPFAVSSWYAPSNPAAGAFYWVRITESKTGTGTTSWDGGFGNWVPLNVARNLRIFSDANPTSVVWTVSIASDAAGSTIVSTATYSLSFTFVDGVDGGGGGGGA